MIGAVVVVFAVASASLGFEVGAIIRKIDAERRVAVVFAKGRELTVKIAADVKIQDEKGKDLSGGLGAPQLKEDTTVS